GRDRDGVARISRASARGLSQRDATACDSRCKSVSGTPHRSFPADPLCGCRDAGRDAVILENRNIIITGASQGLGRAIAEACLREGANVLICARDADMLEMTRSELSAAAPGRAVHARAADVCNESDVHRLFEIALTKFARLDGLVNNAGIYGPKGP